MKRRADGQDKVDASIYARRCPVPEGDPAKEQKFLATFRVNRLLKVLGGEAPEVSMA